MLIIVITLIVAFLAWLFLAGVMAKHQDFLATNKISNKQAKLFIYLGYSFLSLALFICLQTWQMAIAICTWLALIGFAAIILALCFTYAPKLLQKSLQQWLKFWQFF